MGGSRRRDGLATTNNHSFVELRELRYFVVLARELHFGRAAELLHISQPPLSQAIANLERKVGTKLLERTSRQVRLTPAGAVLRDRVEHVLADVDDAVVATRATAAAEAATLRIAAAFPLGETMLPQIASALGTHFPELELDVTQESANEAVERVRHGEADLGLALCPAVDGRLAAKTVRREPAVALVHRQSLFASRESITIGELAQHRLLLWPRERSAGSHDLVVSLFAPAQPASLTVLDRLDAAWWKELVAGAFTVVPAGSPMTPDYVTVPIADSPSDFVTDLVWSEHAPPPLLAPLLDTIGELAQAEGWL